MDVSYVVATAIALIVCISAVYALYQDHKTTKEFFETGTIK